MSNIFTFYFWHSVLKELGLNLFRDQLIRHEKIGVLLFQQAELRLLNCQILDIQWLGTTFVQALTYLFFRKFQNVRGVLCALYWVIPFLEHLESFHPISVNILLILFIFLSAWQPIDIFNIFNSFRLQVFFPDPLVFSNFLNFFLIDLPYFVFGFICLLNVV